MNLENQDGLVIGQHGDNSDPQQDDTELITKELLKQAIKAETSLQEMNDGLQQEERMASRERALSDRWPTANNRIDSFQKEKNDGNIQNQLDT